MKEEGVEGRMFRRVSPHLHGMATEQKQDGVCEATDRERSSMLWWRASKFLTKKERWDWLHSKDLCTLCTR